MYFKVTLADHGTTVKSQIFTIKVYSRCDNPVSLSAPEETLSTISYTITEPELYQTIGNFIADPPECEISVTV